MDVNFFRFMSQEKMYENASYSRNIVPTPPNIARDMLDLMPDNFWRNKDAKVLNLACKDGNFLYRVCELFMEGLKGEIPNEQERLNHIINNCLYACICRDTDIQDRWLGLIDIKKIYSLGCFLDLPESNIFVVDYNKNGLKFYSSNTEKESIEMLEFDLVVGNPPYNSDVYIDFVLQAQELSKGRVVMITPAKWQAKKGKKNDEFREKVVPYMDKIVYYPDESDVFMIKTAGGICYYSLDKEKHDIKEIINKNDRIQAFNSVMTRVYTKYDTLYNFGHEIICKLRGVDLGLQLSKYDKNKRYKVSGSNMAGYCNSRNKFYGWFSTDGNVQVTCKASIYDTKNDEINVSSVAYTSFSSNILSECESFNSYIDTKFVRFLVMIGFCTTGCFKEETWRFVPDPGNFDHIFTDEELYAKYNLIQDEIDIIESVIKSRTK